MESPASEVELVVDQGSVKRGRKALVGRKRSELKVPRMKIKMIGRSRESDSPIFFAQSVEDVSEYNLLSRWHSYLYTHTHTHTTNTHREKRRGLEVKEAFGEEGNGRRKVFGIVNCQWCLPSIS